MDASKELYYRALIEAQVATVKGMEAENEHFRALNGSGVAYDEAAFYHCAAKLAHIAAEVAQSWTMN